MNKIYQKHPQGQDKYGNSIFAHSADRNAHEQVGKPILND